MGLVQSLISIKPRISAVIGTAYCILAIALNFAMFNFGGWKFEVFFSASIFLDLSAIVVGLISMMRMGNPILVFVTLLSWLTILGLFISKAFFTAWMVISALVSI